MSLDSISRRGPLLWLGLGVLLGGLGIAYGLFVYSSKKPGPVPVVIMPANDKGHTAELPVVQTVMPAPVAIKKDVPGVVVTLPPEVPSTPAAPGLPLLEASDTGFVQAIAASLRGLSPAEFRSLLVPKDLIRRFVVVIANSAEHIIPRRHLPVRLPAGHFRVKRSPDGRLFVDKTNYRRYRPYVTVLEALTSQGMLKSYLHFQPLFEQAYREMGYPEGGFNGRMLKAIDVVLSTPIVESGLAVKRLSADYAFVDQSLESLPELQRLMLRMGPDNARRIQARLRVFRKAFLAQGLAQSGGKRP